MENLTPPLLRALREVKWSICAGKSMREAFQSYIERNQDPLVSTLRQLWILKNHQGRSPITPPTLKTYYQRTFWDLIERGSNGQPTVEALNALESEVESAAEAELNEHLSALPFKVLLPLLLFQFPAYLLLLLGPLLRELQRPLGS